MAPLPKAVMQTNFKFPGQTNFYRGKVRDVYTVDDKLVMVASDRISPFDHILPRPIPHKGQMLNQIAALIKTAYQRYGRPEASLFQAQGIMG